MSDETAREALYKTAGEALHFGQLLELNVRSLISLLNRKLNANLDADAIIVSEDKVTLGRLIERLRPHAEFSGDTEAALAEALGARNCIAHDFFIRHTDAFSSDEAMQEATAGLTFARSIGSNGCDGFNVWFC